VVVSQAYVPAPLGRGNLVHTVKVTSKWKGSGAPGGITVKNAINLGSDFLIDSYDPRDPAKSTNGLYDPTKAQANGNLASMSATAGQLMLADSKIFGHLYTTATGGYTGPGDARDGGRPGISKDCSERGDDRERLLFQRP
jgi:hypothetical protein